MEGKLMDYETDYLVIGSGATAMAFVDMMLTQTDATFLMVDRRPKVGGHWNDAYPFVRLHQPSGFYGVASRPLGRHRLDETGFNTGFLELATGVEVLNYFHSLMDEVFIPSKRVQYLPLCDYTDNGTIGFYPVTADIPKKRHTVPKECSCPDAENIAQSSNAKPSP
jgi:hypothetical protein